MGKGTSSLEGADLYMHSFPSTAREPEARDPWRHEWQTKLRITWTHDLE